MVKRAPFIVFEGLDRSGKTTLTTALHARLQDELGISTHLMKFPDRTTAIGQMIDSYLKSQAELDDHAIHLLFSANRWELASLITSHLTSGTVVICDRYAFSGAAFSAAKQPTLNSAPAPASTHKFLPLPWCRAPDAGLPAPDLTIFLDVHPQIARLRAGYGGERYEEEGLQKRVREVFGQIGEEVSRQNAGENKRWVVIDSGRSKEDVQRDIWELVEPLVKNGVDEPVLQLWEDLGLV